MVYQTDRGGHPPGKPSADGSTTQSSPTGEDFLPWTVPPSMVRPSELRIPYPHFALIGLDARGNIRCRSSRSTERYLPLLFTREFQEKFVQSTGMRTNSHSPVFSGNAYSGPKSRHPRPEVDLFSPYPPRKRRRREPSPFSSREEEDYQNDLSYELPNRLGIEIGDEEKIVAYYKSAWMALQQLTCRQLAKAYIKAIEPRKQVKHPYNQGEESKPDWWPPGVIHKEPDHLRKPDRVELLVHILRKLLKTYDVTVDTLEEASQEIYRKLDPERRDILDEIYRVRRAEESYEQGEIDTSTVIYVTNREPPKKSSEREESASDAGRGETPLAEIEHDPETRGAPAMTTPVDTKYNIRVSEPLQPDEQHTGFPSPSDLRAMFMDSKPPVQPDVDYLISTPVEQPAMMGHWPSVFQHSPHSHQQQQQPTQPQPLFVNVDYGSGPTDQILSPTVMRPHQHAMIPVSSESAVGGVPIANLTGARAQQSFDFMSPTMAGHPAGAFRASAISHPHYSPHGGSMPMQSMQPYKQL